jgi:hypothetical protein
LTLLLAVGVSTGPLLARNPGDTHYEAFLNYVTCDDRRFSAFWNGDSFKHVREGGGETVFGDWLAYKTHGGICYWLKWDPVKQQFEHHRGAANGPVHWDEIVNYVTWDGGYYTGFRDGNRWFHLFVREGPRPTQGDLEIVVRRVLDDPVAGPLVKNVARKWLQSKGVPVK